jgi:hypothetical protein
VQRSRSCVDQAIALPANGAQIAREGRIGLNLAPQTRDLNVDGALVDGRADALAQRLAASGTRLPLLVSSPSSWSNWKGPNETMRCGSPGGPAAARLRFSTFWMRSRSSRGSKGLPR